MPGPLESGARPGGAAGPAGRSGAGTGRRGSPGPRSVARTSGGPGNSGTATGVRDQARRPCLAQGLAPRDSADRRPRREPRAVRQDRRTARAAPAEKGARHNIADGQAAGPDRPGTAGHGGRRSRDGLPSPPGRSAGRTSERAGTRRQPHRDRASAPGIREAGPALGIHPRTVERHAASARRRGPRGRTDVDDDLIVRLRDGARLIFDEIAGLVGMSRSPVRRRYYHARGLDTPGDRPLPKWRTTPQGPVPARTASMTAQPREGTAGPRMAVGFRGPQGKAGPVAGPKGSQTGRSAR
jgi:hypothetical protein